MARFAESEIEQVKRETDLAALVRRSGVELKAHGEDLIGLCPLHPDPDHEPSLVVSPKKGLWHCLGACRTGGSALDWLMKLEGISFREAMVRLRGGGLALAPTAKRSAAAETSVLPASAPHIANSELLARVVAVYHASYRASAAAQAYAAQRGIGSADAAERFAYGCAEGTLVTALGEALRPELIRLGMVSAKTGSDHLAGCFVLPIYDRAGRVVNLYGRRIEERNGLPKHLYLPGPRRGVFNLAAFQDTKELILCEALIDALTFWCHGFQNVTTAYGVNGFTADLFEAIREHGIERVWIAYDRDGAGEAAAQALAPQLETAGIGCFRVLFPKGMDANAYALHVAPAERALALTLQSAEWMAGPKTRPGQERPKLLSLPAPQPFIPLPAAPPAVAEAAAKEEKTPGKEETKTGTGFDPFDLVLGARAYRVRGLSKNLSYDKLQVVVRIACGERVFLDTVDLVAARQRRQFLHQASVELGLDETLLRQDLGTVALALEALQDERIRTELSPKTPAPAVPPEAEREALAFLQRPDLVAAILEDFDRCGLVGERVNKLVGYLAAVSRKLDRPLAVVVQSSSAAGKSALLDAILALVPEEERVAYSAMTGQSLFYMGETDLEHKLLAIAEEAGAERAAYALKLLQSEGQLTIASTGKDPHSGKLVTHEYRVEGPTAILMTTTAIDVDEELMNRCLVLTVDEDREQTRAIHRQQREAETLEGLLAERQRRRILERHQNAQRLLKPVKVINPWARELTFLDDQTRTRRDHQKYLALIRSIALLFQHQRPRQTAVDGGELVEYLEATLEDIALANHLAHEVLGRTLDELPPQTRRLLSLLEAWLRGECERHGIERPDFLFSRRQVREAIGWSDPQVRKHLDRLVDLEYLLVRHGTRGQSYVYELLYDGQGQDGSRFLPGLIDVEQLATAKVAPGPESLIPFSASLTPSEKEFDPSLTPHSPPVDPRLHEDKKRRKPRQNGALLTTQSKLFEKARLQEEVSLLAAGREGAAVEPLAAAPAGR